MISRPSIRESTLIGRSMRISGTTRLMSAALAGGVSVNAALAMQFVGTGLTAALAGVFFVLVALGAWGISRDLCTRSAQAISSLRSIGATKSSLASAVFVPILTYGCGAAAVGALVGVMVGEFALGGAYSLLQVLLYGVMMGVLSAAASAVGAFAGVRN